MDLSKMTDEEARETVSRMLQEMDRMANGGVSESEDDSDIEDDVSEVPPAKKAPSTEQASSAEQAPSSEQGPSTEEVQPGDETATAATEDAPKKKKKKKKSKKKTANLPDLEELLRDVGPPEPEDPFDLSKSVAERVEIAVTRFRKNRKFTTERAQIFSSYLAYGGIQTGQKSFQGGAPQSEGPGEAGEPDFEAMHAGVDLVNLPEEGQVVDFTNVVTTFLSQHFLKCTGWIDMTYYKDTPLVVASLMKYFLVRNVLPEHEEDVKTALAVAERAQIELPLCKLISNGLPGRFSKACSVVYDGEWHNFLDNTWQDHSQLVETLGMDRPTARKIVQSVFGPDLDLESVKLKPREFMDLEIVEVEMPKDLDPSNSPDETEPSSGLAPEDEAKVVEMVDRMLLGETRPPDSNNEEPTPSLDGPEPALAEGLMHVPLLAKVTLAEMDPALPRLEQAPIEQRRHIVTYFDPSIATKMVLGMRMEACVYTLSNDISYLEQASVYPTFYLEADEVDGDAVGAAEWDDD